jgi:UDP-N-acetylmuramoylalanine--D-glutamate ligase
MKKINFLTSRFAVIGLGDTGASIIRYLNYKNGTIKKIFDTRNNPPNQDLLPYDVELITGSLNFNNFKDIDVLILSPGISIYEEAIVDAINNNILVIGDIELFAQEIVSWNSKVVAITGSNGKTTVTTLLGETLTKLGYNTLVAGNIGKPVLDSYIECVNSNNTPEMIVLELSSFQLETVYSLYLDAAVVLNISEDHLDRYDNLLHYAYTKSRIFKNAKIQILNNDDKIVVAMNNKVKLNIRFGLNSDANYYLSKNNDDLYLCFENQQLINCCDINLIGMHNYLNVLAVLAILSALGINVDDKVKYFITQFTGVKHRMQKVAVINGITFVEDSKGTNVGATIAGVSGLDAPVNLILGGDGKNQTFEELYSLVANKCRSVAIIGQDKLKIAKVLQSIDHVAIKVCDNLEEAVLFCYNNGVLGDFVVLSPACASWDMFKNYIHRADVFINIVQNLIKS